MPLTPQQKLDLLSIGKEKWIDAESSLYAYERAIRQARTRSDWLKAGTILGALLTTSTGFSNVSWLTVGTGLLTTALATVERLFSPAENLQKYWNNRSGLDKTKQDLSNFAITLDTITDLIEGSQPLTQIGQQIIAMKQEMPVMPSDEEKVKAGQAFQLTTIAQITNRLKEELGEHVSYEDVTVVELPEDATDVVPVLRPNSQ
ncbi:MAG: hypothetical protein MUO76_21570 [Anaerolineaceae bacterium]|nr:hypothetical protein [Anaerolineaceae bacterium]